MVPMHLPPMAPMNRVEQIRALREERTADRAEWQAGFRVAAGRLQRCVACEVPPFVRATVARYSLAAQTAAAAANSATSSKPCNLFQTVGAAKLF